VTILLRLLSRSKVEIFDWKKRILQKSPQNVSHASSSRRERLLRFSAKNALENASVVVRLFARFVFFCVFKRERERERDRLQQDHVHKYIYSIKRRLSEDFDGE
jgi:hypothetical protein